MDGIPGLIKGLLRPGAYAHRPGGIELRQTHISYLVFTPEFVYKIKKPVNFGFLDFTTLERRLFFCNEEVRLNRRLAPGAYLGVTGITERDGMPFMGGPGEPVEYAVWMRRLDEGRMLGRMLSEGAATADTAKRVAGVIASFHAKAEAGGRIPQFGSVSSIRGNALENFDQTAPFIGRTISAGLYGGIKGYTEGFISLNAPMIEKRVAGGFIRDCHGDIHSGHVFLENGVSIIDCIEFNERFRYSDVIADIAFLSMDLDRHNRHDLARALDAAYFEGTGDYEGARLMDFYRCYRAFVRGKVEGFKAFEPEVDRAERDLAFLDAAFHFHLSGLYASGGFRPMLVVVLGPSGTGKSTLAGGIAGRTGFVHLSSDRIRKELAGLPPGERRPEPFGKGIYSEEFTEKTYEALVERGKENLRLGRSVVLDATFGRRGRLQKAKEGAKAAGGDFRVIECTALNTTVRERLSSRGTGPGGAVSDADWEIYLSQKALFEEVKGAHAVVRAEEPLSESLKSVFSSIFG